MHKIQDTDRFNRRRLVDVFKYKITDSFTLVQNIKSFENIYTLRDAAIKAFILHGDGTDKTVVQCGHTLWSLTEFVWLCINRQTPKYVIFDNGQRIKKERWNRLTALNTYTTFQYY